MGIDINLTIENAPYKLRYTPDNNKIYCTFDLNFKKSMKISKIEYGLCGKAIVTVYGPNNQVIIKPYEFLDIKNDMNIESEFEERNGFKIFTIPKHKKIENKSIIEIPQDRYLLSSYSRLGDGIKYGGDIQIKYKVYIKIYRIGGLFKKGFKVLKYDYWDIYYQSCRDLKLNGNNKNDDYNILNYNKFEIFKNKVKTFYYDSEFHALIPTSITKNHNKIRFFLKLLDKNYQDENFKLFTKSIPIEINLSLPSIINIKNPIINQFNINLIFDLKKWDINYNQSTDFVFNGRSTHLGIFKIESLTIKLKYNLKAKCYLQNFRYQNSHVILDTKFDKFLIDLKDFEYDKELGRCKIDIRNENLMELSLIDLRQSIMDIMGDENIIFSGRLDDWFENDVSIEFKLVISDGLSMAKEFNFETTSTPDL